MQTRPTGFDMTSSHLDQTIPIISYL